MADDWAAAQREQLLDARLRQWLAAQDDADARPADSTVTDYPELADDWQRRVQFLDWLVRQQCALSDAPTDQPIPLKNPAPNGNNHR